MRRGQARPPSAAVVGNDLCMHTHAGFLARGDMHIEYADGCVVEYTAPQGVAIDPGDDGWVVGKEPVVLIERDFGPDTVSRLGMPAEHRHWRRTAASALAGLSVMTRFRIVVVAVATAMICSPPTAAQTPQYRARLAPVPLDIAMQSTIAEGQHIDDHWTEPDRDHQRAVWRGRPDRSPLPCSHGVRDAEGSGLEPRRDSRPAQVHCRCEQRVRSVLVHGRAVRGES